MTADPVVGGGHTVALALGKTGVHASVDGGEPKKFPVRGQLTSKTLAKALDIFTQGNTLVLIIGTRADGTPGWDEIDPEDLKAATTHEVRFFSEAQALSFKGEKQPSAWLILATALSDPSQPQMRDNIKGSARWWVQDANGIASMVEVDYLRTKGQLFTMSGGNLATSPIMVASMVEHIIAQYPHVTRVYVWSQDGLAGNVAYQPDGIFWSALRLPEVYEALGGDVAIVATAFDAIQTASGYKPPVNTAREGDIAAGISTAKKKDEE